MLSLTLDSVLVALKATVLNSDRGKEYETLKARGTSTFNVDSILVALKATLARNVNSINYSIFVVLKDMIKQKSTPTFERIFTALKASIERNFNPTIVIFSGSESYSQ